MTEVAALQRPGASWRRGTPASGSYLGRGCEPRHLDLYTDDQDGEVERLRGLGAGVVRHDADDPDGDFVVTTDPEGSEFCVCLRPGADY